MHTSSKWCNVQDVHGLLFWKLFLENRYTIWGKNSFFDNFSHLFLFLFWDIVEIIFASYEDENCLTKTSQDTISAVLGECNDGYNVFTCEGIQLKKTTYLENGCTGAVDEIGNFLYLYFQILLFWLICVFIFSPPNNFFFDKAF